MPLEPAPLGDVSAKQGLVKSHRFTAVNTALPFLRGDQETIDRIERFVRDEKLSVDVLALRQGERFGELVAPLNKTSTLIQAGDEVQIDVVVRNRGVGHTFPGGTNDSNQGWIEFSVFDDDGDPLLVSGEVDENRVVDPESRFYHAVLVDRNGKRIQRRDGQNIHTAVYARTIGPGTADVGRYRFTIPKTAAGKQLVVKARLLWRKFDRAYTGFAYRSNPKGFSGFDEVPDLPITEIASDSVAIRVSSIGVEDAVQASQEDWMRYNDYGIGLLLQGDTRNANQAFEAVTAADPDRVDGYRNLARIAVAEGNIDSAFRYLERCESIASGDPQTAWVWGTAHQRAGSYEEAAGAYQRVLKVFPEDRAAWRNLGRVSYLNGNFEEALNALNQVLSIDPEDRTAHYHRMLALRALGRKDEAARAERAYLKYQIDESAKEVTQAFLLDNPEVERAAQRIQIYFPRPPRSDRESGRAGERERRGL